MRQTFAIGIGGAAGQGVATPGAIFAKIFSRRGLHLNAYNAYQSIIRGGHTFLTIRTGPEKVTNMGDRLDLLIPLNQDAVNRPLGLLTAGAACIYNADTIKPGTAADGVQLCPLPVSKLAGITRNKVGQNTLALGARPQGWHYGPPGGRRNWRSEHGNRCLTRRRPLHVRNLGGRLCPDERRSRLIGHDGDASRSHRLPARWPLHGSSHEDGTG